MKEANKNNYMKANIKYIRIFVISILVCFTFGVSYALLTASYTSNKNHIITVGSLKLTLDDSASSGITLSNALPESDTNGLKEQDYTFTLTNTGTATFVYNLNLVDNTLDSGLTRTPDNSVKY